MTDDSAARKRSNLRSIDGLISRALAEESSDSAWECIHTLRSIGSRRVLQKSRELCLSESPTERKLGVDILGQLGVPVRTFPDDCADTLLAMLEIEDDADVLGAIGVALGHLRSTRGVEKLRPLRYHPDARVRFGVAFGVLGQETEMAIDTLLHLMEDTEIEVRDWATFGIGSLVDIDTPAIRDALFRRVSDPDEEVRGEALVGLARRRDERTSDAIAAALAKVHVDCLVLDAAAELCDSKLHSALIDLQRRAARTRKKEEKGEFAKAVRNAIWLCRPKPKDGK